MKKFTSTIAVAVLILSMFLPQYAMAQSPQKMSYQSVVRNATGDLVTESLVGIQISIIQGSAIGAAGYVETHSAMTNVNGLVSLELGMGTMITGTFVSIDWGNGPYFIKTDVDPSGGNSYSMSATTELLSVPYALYSETTGNPGAYRIDDLMDAKTDADSSSMFLGIAAGLNDDGSDNKGLGIGFEALKNNTTGDRNTALGYQSLFNNTTGSFNIANGYRALFLNTTGSFNTATGIVALYSNTSGARNTADGYYALFSNTTGFENTAIGMQALRDNTIGYWNTAFGFSSLSNNVGGYGNTAQGFQALNRNTEGIENTATGAQALFFNNVGNFNTAAGYFSLKDNTSGSGNTGIGYYALKSNITASSNTAIGFEALTTNIDGHSNTANGKSALRSNTSGNDNTATGFEALFNNDTGIRGTAIGFQALYTNTSGNYNTAIGFNALFSMEDGNWNTAIGRQALFDQISGNNNIGVGYLAEVPSGNGSNQIRIGNSSITYAGIQVGWSVTSDKRWKDEIRALPYGLDFVKQLEPVDYVRKDNDAATREMGFIAQDVEALLTKVGYADQGFLTKDDEGYISLRYNDFIALLTKAIQEQQEIIDNQNSEIGALTAKQNETDERLNKMEALLNSSKQHASTSQQASK